MTDDEADRVLASADPEDIERARQVMSTWSAEEVRRFADDGTWPDDPLPVLTKPEAEE